MENMIVRYTISGRNREKNHQHPILNEGVLKYNNNNNNLNKIEP